MENYIERQISPLILEAYKYYPVILISGARQVGKSTLCKHLFPDFKYVNLEDNDTLFFAESDIKGFVGTLGNKAIIDEAQRCPKLFSQLQVMVDADPSLRFILTGSSDFILMKSACQSLAGRIALFTLPPLTFKELNEQQKNIETEKLFYRGFYPGVISGKRPVEFFYRNYYNTYIEKDIRTHLKLENLTRFDTFMKMIAARVGSEFNASAVAVEVGVSSNTIKEWLSILQASYIVFPLQPYYANITKRLTKMSKWYFYDTGLVAFLLGIGNSQQIEHHPLKGALFENMAVAEMMNEELNDNQNPNLNFYRERSGREIDILKVLPEGVEAYEVKASKTFNKELIKNLDYIKKVLGDSILSTSLIYDGQTLSPNILNIREI